MTIPRESTESSSPIITRAVAGGLNNQLVDNYEFPGWQKYLLLGLGEVPQEFARFAISGFQSVSGLPEATLKNFSLDELIQDRINDYASLDDQYPSVVLGAGLGGATTYLSIALNAPFLPQAFVISLRNGSMAGDVNQYLNRTIDSALEIAKKDSRLVTIQHFDPVHDGWLTKFVNHLRFKLVELPQAYIDFIHTHIVPGGAVVFLNGGAKWLRYRLGERSFFQVGGWGDIPVEEFLEGSPRLTEFAKLTGLKFDHWCLNSDHYPLEIGPESEWGCETGLADALEKFCSEEGYSFIKIDLPHPNDFSYLAFSAAKKMIEKDGHIPQGTLIECFSQFDCTSAFQASLLPLWLIFNTQDSARYLTEMSKYFPGDKPIFFSPLSTFSLTPDMASWQHWKKAIGRDFINIGTRECHYPSDARALVKWTDPLRRWVTDHKSPLLSRLEPEELQKLAKEILKLPIRKARDEIN